MCRVAKFGGIVASVVSVLVILVMAAFLLVVGGSSLTACPAQPRLPELLFASGICAVLFSVSMATLGCLCLPCVSAESPSGGGLKKRCMYVSLLLAAVVFIVIVLSLHISVWYVFERDITVQATSGPPKDCDRLVCGAPRKMNPEVSLYDVAHPKYCSRQLVGFAAVVCTIFFLLVESAAFMLPVLLCCGLICCRSRHDSVSLSASHDYKVLKEEKSTPVGSVMLLSA